MSAEEAGAGQSSSTRAVDTGLLSLAVLARLQGKPAQPEQLRHELGLTGPASADDLLRAAKRLDLKAKKAALDVRRLEAGTAPLPCIVERRSVASRARALRAGERSDPHRAGARPRLQRGARART